MRKPDAAFAAARKAPSPAATRDDAPAKLVCLALALLALAARIVSIW